MPPGESVWVLYTAWWKVHREAKKPIVFCVHFLTLDRNWWIFFTYIDENISYTHPFNGPLPGLPGWAGTRKVKPIWILLKQETVSGSGISWATCRQITMPAPHHSVFTGRMPFLPPNQQRQSTEGKKYMLQFRIFWFWHTIRYDTRCYFNVRSKADISQLNLPHGTDN